MRLFGELSWPSAKNRAEFTWWNQPARLWMTQSDGHETFKNEIAEKITPLPGYQNLCLIQATISGENGLERCREAAHFVRRADRDAQMLNQRRKGAANQDLLLTELLDDRHHR